MTQGTSQDDDHVWRRRLAAQANNRGWELSEMRERSAAEDAEMLDAAHASRFLWRKIADERAAAHADLLLGHVYALLGNGSSAMKYARSAFGFLSNKEPEPWELAFAHAVLGNAAHADGDIELHRSEYLKAIEAANALTDPEDRKIFEATFSVTPKP